MLNTSALKQAVVDPKRLEILQGSDLLDSPPEEAFDRYTRLASHILHAPVALISLVDVNRQFFKSQHGLTEPLASVRETPLSHSFCKHLLGTSKPLIVDDARSHPLLRHNPAIECHKVVAYLGVPLQTSEGHTLGSLCTIDAKPRHWSDEDIRLLQDIGVSVMTEIQLRLLAKHLLSSYLHMRDLEMQRDELTHMLVHDLRNPLNSLLMGLELVQCSTAVDSKTLRYVSLAQHGAQSLLRMVSDILDVSQSEAGKLELNLEPRDINDLVVTACQQIEVMAYEAGVTVIQDVDDYLPAIMIDAEKLRRVLVNLLSNAVQHTPHPGTVKIVARRSPDWQSLVLQVKDTGVGMPTESFSEIFEKFGRVHGRKTSGRVSTGLGLPFCKKAIEAHGGKISVSSELGHGTVFRIEIPYEHVQVKAA